MDETPPGYRSTGDQAKEPQNKAHAEGRGASFWCPMLLKSSGISKLSDPITIPKIVGGMLMSSFVSLALPVE